MDVSARIAVSLLETAEALGYDPTPALRGMPFTRDDLSDWSRRLHWNDYIELFERVGAILGRENVIRGVDMYEKQVPEMAALAGAVITPAQYARLHCIISARSFPVIRGTYDVNDERVILDGSVSTALRGSELFWEMSTRTAAMIPRVLGYPKPEVEARWTAHSAWVKVPLPPSRALPTRGREVMQRYSENALRWLSAILSDFSSGVAITMEPPTSPAPTERDAEMARRWGLTPRESRALALLALGRSNKEIATALGCSVRTAESHVAKVLAKSGCASRAEVTAAYWQAR